MGKCTLCAVIVLLLQVDVAYFLGCIPKICDGNPSNELRACPDGDSTCGDYLGKRSGGRIVKGVDIKCSANAIVYAPFDGQMYYWRPYGGRDGYECADQGARIEGTGQWQGYLALISSVNMNFYGGEVKQGQEIGKAISRHCIGDIGLDDFQDHLQFLLYRQGDVIDPTYHLKDCQCTGQICQTNGNNQLVGQPFKSDGRYNGVKGWAVQCPLTEEGSTPAILSPIDGSLIGRIRLYQDEQRQYSGCDNDGLFILGREAWKDYEVRLYNVKLREDLEEGRQAIEQGQEIGTRLGCDNSPDSVHMEVRHHGHVVDITDLILANNCKQSS